jgi:hypothetical protein
MIFSEADKEVFNAQRQLVKAIGEQNLEARHTLVQEALHGLYNNVASIDLRKLEPLLVDLDEVPRLISLCVSKA